MRRFYYVCGFDYGHQVDSNGDDPAIVTTRVLLAPRSRSCLKIAKGDSHRPIDRTFTAYNAAQHQLLDLDHARSNTKRGLVIRLRHQEGRTCSNTETIQVLWLRSSDKRSSYRASLEEPRSRRDNGFGRGCPWGGQVINRLFTEPRDASRSFALHALVT
jgi:hypothetical protein